MSNAVIVQARYSSSRLPGKVLEKIAGKTILEHVFQRIKKVGNIDHICCATVDDPSCDEIAKEADRLGVIVFRGSQDDVLGRYYNAAKMLGADNIMRITSDCPVIDPQICQNILDEFLLRNVDYAANNMPPSWPHGLDAEVFSFKWLEKAAKEAVDKYDREHVTPFIRNHPEASKVNCPAPNILYSGYRWTLDYPEDLEFFKNILQLVEDGSGDYGYLKLVDIIKANPEFAEINQIRSVR